MIEKLEEVVKKVTSPANRIGTFLGATSKDTAHIVVGGADYYCNVDPRIPLAKLKKGTRGSLVSPSPNPNIPCKRKEPRLSAHAISS